METRKFFVADAFTTSRFDGNRAGVVTDGTGLDDGDMLRIAGEIGASETAFVFADSDADLHLRFFSPTVEVPFCGHAFVGALATLVLTKVIDIAGEYGRVRVRTGAGVREAEMKLGDGWAEVTMHQADPLFRPNTHPADVVCRALGIEPSALFDELPLKLAYTGLWHLLVPLASPEAVRAANPVFPMVKAINEDAGVHTTHIFAPEREGYFCRSFAPVAGVDEDPFTGSASGALVAYLVGEGSVSPGHPVTLEQRDAAGRGGTAVVIVGGTSRSPEKVSVTGRAVLSMEGVVMLDR